MHIFLPYKKPNALLRATEETLTRRGHSCTPVPFVCAQQMRSALEKQNYDLVLGSEGDVLRKIKCEIPKVYLASDFFCDTKLGGMDCALVLIPHEALTFDFINSGARENCVQVCGIPLCEENRQLQKRDDTCKALGLSHDKNIFTLFTDGVSKKEIKSTVHAAERLCPDVQILVMSNDSARRTAWQTAFAQLKNVFVLPTDLPLGVSVGDAVFMPALPSLFCAAARAEKICLLFHVRSRRCRMNAAFLEERGAAFCGKTAADTVSYTVRLLEGERLRANMLRAEESVVSGDPEHTLCEVLEQHLKTQKKH